MAQNVIAFANNDVVTIAWSVEPRPAGCMGYAINRIDTKGVETALPSFAVFPGIDPKTVAPKDRTLANFPVQKFYWKDPYARLVAAKTGSRKFRYRVVPLKGTKKHLVPMGLPQMVSNEVEVTPRIGTGIEAYFNRGLISTQRVSRAFKGTPNAPSLKSLISKKGDALRLSLAGEMVDALGAFAARAKKSGRIYAALYELADDELVTTLEKLGKRLSIVLTNAVQTDKDTNEKSDENQGARDRLKKTAGVKWDRLLPNGHIGHNKFAVYEDATKKPRAVLLGSTNWTSTGLCAQTNNTLVIEDDALAKRYRDYWERLAADTKSAKHDPKALQAKALRSWSQTGKSFTLSGGSVAGSWFSPNTPKARSSNTKNEARPVDMAELVKRVNAAKQSILFLAFFPGTPSIANWAAAAQRANKDLFVRGCVTNPSAAEGFYYELKGMTPPKKVKGQKTAPRVDPKVIQAQALDRVIPKGWQKELLKAGFAIVHDKIVVIDAFSDDCVVVTGSHNLGHRASYNNDENLLMIEGNKKLASAYATHVLDVYDHFAWRWMVQQGDQKAADQSLCETDAWMDKYYGPSGTIRTAQLRFWMSALP